MQLDGLPGKLAAILSRAIWAGTAASDPGNRFFGIPQNEPTLGDALKVPGRSSRLRPTALRIH